MHIVAYALVVWIDTVMVITPYRYATMDLCTQNARHAVIEMDNKLHIDIMDVECVPEMAP